MFDEKPAIGGLARSLAIWMAGFVLISELALVAWVRVWNQDRSLEALNDLAVSNAAFITEMRLPPSTVLARRLSTVLDMEAGFYFPQATGSWPAALGEPVAALARREGAAAGRAAGFEIATAPLPDNPQARLVLIRAAPGFGPGVLIPTLGLALGCGGLALVLGRGLVRPLGTLTGWLPHLEAQAEDEPPPLAAPLLARRDEIGSLARALDQTARRLREEQRLRHQSERLATLGRIATSLAHEIKNPAAAIGLHADVLRGEVAPGHRESVSLIREEVGRITDLINQWLYVARAQPGRRERHDLRELLEAVVKRMTPLFDHARVKLEVGRGEKAVVDVDAPRVEQALRNVLLNAAQAMPEGGVIRAVIRRADGWIELQIDDQGPGFSAEALRRFGEPFFSEREGGMGIGLTLALEVLEAHGGSIHPGNTPGGGARIVCRLPSVEAEVP